MLLVVVGQCEGNLENLSFLYIDVVLELLFIWHPHKHQNTDRSAVAETQAEMYEGLSGIRTVYELMLRDGKVGDTICILGAPREAGEKLDGYFDDFNRRRIAAGIRLRIILNYAHPREQKLQHLQKTQVRIFPKTVVTPSWIIILGGMLQHVTSRKKQ